MFEHNWLLYIAAFATAFGVSLVSTPFAKRMSIRFNAIDYPKKRGMHNRPIPRMGGLAIFLGFFVSVLMLVFFLPSMRTVEFLGFVVGAFIIFGIGVYDDIHHIRARVKLFFQIIAALVVIFTGTRITVNFGFLNGFFEQFNAPITFLWIIGVTNAVNLIDGIDGLAAGVCSISAFCLMILCIISGTPLAVALAATIAGSCFGFLPRNFSPAEVFMGDSGALFLGYALAVFSIIGVFKSYAILSVLIALLALALPIFDTTFAIARRIFNRKPITMADRGHLHHRLIDMGYSPRKAVIILYILSSVAGLISILIALKDVRAILVGIFCLVVVLLMMFVYKKRTSPLPEAEAQKDHQAEATAGFKTEILPKKKEKIG